MTPQTIDLLKLIVPLLVAALGGPPAIKRGLAWWAGWRERRDAAREQIAIAALEVEKKKGEIAIATVEAEKQKEEHEERTEARLWERLASVETKVGECHDERKRDREEHARQRAADRKACDEEIAAVKNDVAAVARRTRSLMRDADTTGVHELQAIEERSTQSPMLPPPPRLPPPPPRRR